MAVKFPQHDLPNTLGQRLSGGSDTWDNDLAGAIITADYFEAAAAVTATLTATLADATLSSNATVTPAGGAVTATLAATLADATLASNATVTRNITATLAATLAPATLASNATVTPAAGAITATLAATLADATLTGAATVGSVAPPVQQFGGGGSSIHWRVAAKQRRKLEEAIRAALRGDEPAAAVEVATEVATEVQRDWTLPQPADFSSEAAHIAALSAEVDRISVAIARQNRQQAEDLQRRRVAKAKALAAKVQKVLRIVDLADAA